MVCSFFFVLLSGMFCLFFLAVFLFFFQYLSLHALLTRHGQMPHGYAVSHFQPHLLSYLLLIYYRYTPVQEAKRRAWNSYHGSRLEPSKKKRIQLGVNHPDHRGRMTSPERRFSMEHSLRGELLAFDAKTERATKDTYNDLQLMDQASPPRGQKSSPVQRREYEKALAAERAKVRETEALRRAWEKRIAREGLVNSGDVMSLFSPELLVATSNDDMNVSEVIEQVVKRGGSPTNWSYRRPAQGDQAGYREDGNRIGGREEFTVGKMVRDERHPKSDETKMEAKRDVLATFRERQRIDALPKYSSTPGGIHIEKERRYQIESEVLGEQHATARGPVPATDLLSPKDKSRLAAHRGKMLSMGDLGAYREQIQMEQQQVDGTSAQAQAQGAAFSPSSPSVPSPPPPPFSAPPPPAPPPGPPPMEEDASDFEDITAMRAKLEAMKAENARLASSITDANRSRPGHSSAAAGQASPMELPSAPSSASPSLQARIEAIKTKANADLDRMWDASKAAKRVPLPKAPKVQAGAAYLQGPAHGPSLSGHVAKGSAGKAAMEPNELAALPSLSAMLRRNSME